MEDSGPKIRHRPGAGLTSICPLSRKSGSRFYHAPVRRGSVTLALCGDTQDSYLGGRCRLAGWYAGPLYVLVHTPYQIKQMRVDMPQYRKGCTLLGTVIPRGNLPPLSVFVKTAVKDFALAGVAGTLIQS